MRPHITNIQLHPTDPTLADVVCKCMFCGKSQVIVVPVEGAEKWQNGMLIQDALPTLSADQREALISGICPSCFPKEDDAGEDDLG